MSGICKCGGPDHYPAPHYSRREALRIRSRMDEQARRNEDDATGQDAEAEMDREA